MKNSNSNRCSLYPKTCTRIALHKDYILYRLHISGIDITIKINAKNHVLRDYVQFINTQIETKLFRVLVVRTSLGSRSWSVEEPHLMKRRIPILNLI